MGEIIKCVKYAAKSAVTLCTMQQCNRKIIESNDRYTIRDVIKAVNISLSWVHFNLKRI